MARVEAQIAGLERRLDELDTQRLAVALALEQQRLRLAAHRCAQVQPPRPRPAAPPRPVRRTPPTVAPASWWTRAAAEGFTQQVLRSHLHRMTASREATFVEGDTW